MFGISIGQVLSIKHTFSQEDFNAFALLTGDNNPIHVDLEFASRTRFGRTVAHGMMLYSVLSSGLSGFNPRLVQASQALKFVTPTYTGEEVTFRLEVTAIDEANGLVQVDTRAIRPSGDLSVEGTAVLRQSRDPEPSPEAGIVDPVASYSSGTLGPLAVGQSASQARTFTTKDIAAYTRLTGDNHPIYSGPAGPVVPGPLLGGMFSDLLGTRLPGRGTNWLKQQMTYHHSVLAGEPITATVTITRLRPDKALVNLSTICTNSANDILCSGEALVLVQDLEAK